MDHEKRIKALEAALETEEAKIKGIFLDGKIPATEDYAIRDLIKKGLKTARTARTKEGKSDAPKLIKQVTVRLTEEEFRELTAEAAAAVLTLPKYIRYLLKARPGSGVRGPF